MWVSKQTIAVLLTSVSILSCGNNKSSFRGAPRAAQPHAETKGHNPATTLATDRSQAQTSEKNNDASDTEIQNKQISTNQLEMSVFAKTGLDSIRSFLHHRLESKNKNHAAQAEELAQSIQNVKVNIDSDSNTVFIKITQDNRENILVGKLNMAGVAIIPPSKRGSLSAQFICLNRIETECFNSVIEIQDRSRNNATAIILNQKSNANFRFKKHLQSGEQNAVAVFNTYLSNTEELNNSKQSIRSILVETFEVINARSAIRIAFIARDGQTIYVQGPLLVSSTQSHLTNIPLELSYTLDDLKAFERFVGNLTTNLAEQFSEIALVQFSSLGKVTLSFRSNQIGGQTDSMLIELFILKNQLKNVSQVQKQLLN